MDWWKEYLPEGDVASAATLKSDSSKKRKKGKTAAAVEAQDVHQPSKKSKQPGTKGAISAPAAATSQAASNGGGSSAAKLESGAGGKRSKRKKNKNAGKDISSESSAPDGSDAVSGNENALLAAYKKMMGEKDIARAFDPSLPEERREKVMDLFEDAMSIVEN